MADIFISYSRDYRALTEALAEHLQARGYTVWWDTSLLLGQPFHEEIRRELDAAKVAIVIWSPAAVKSDWVISEARRAREQGKLITVRSADLNLGDIPPPFDVLHTDLVDDIERVDAAIAKLGGLPNAGEVILRMLRSMSPLHIAIAVGAVIALFYFTQGEKRGCTAQDWERTKKTGELSALRAMKSYCTDTLYGHLADQEVNRRDDAAFVAAKTTNTMEAYNAYIAEWPKGRSAENARQAVRLIELDVAEKADFAAAKAANTVAAYKNYLKRWESGGHFIKEANQAIYDLEVADFTVAKATNTVAAYKDYLKRWESGGHFIKEANQAIYDLEVADFTAAKATNTVAAYRDYLNRWSDGGHFIKEAKQAISDLQEAEDRAAWSKATAGGVVADFEAYLKAFPSGTHASEARSLIRQRNRGLPIRTFSLPGKVTSVAFSPDGHTALSSTDQDLTLWDVTTGNRIQTFTGYTGIVSSVAFSPNDRRVLSGSSDNTLILWDIDSGNVIRTFTGHKSGVTSVAFSPDGRTALSGSLDKTSKLWDLAGREIRPFPDVYKEKLQYAKVVAFSPDGRRFFDNSNGGFIFARTSKLIIRDVATKSVKLRLVTGNSRATAAAFSPDGRFILAGSEKQGLRLWDVSEGVQQRNEAPRLIRRQSKPSTDIKIPSNDVKPGGWGFFTDQK
jgi:hypothetical protein